MNPTILPPATDKFLSRQGSLTMVCQWSWRMKTLNSKLLNSASEIDLVSHSFCAEGLVKYIECKSDIITI